MRSFANVLAMLILTVFLTMASAYVGEERRIDTNQTAVEKIGHTYTVFQTSDPEKATELDQVLRKEAGYGVDDILMDSQKLEAKGVKALREIGIRVKYVHSVYTEPIGFLLDNFLRFVLFFVLSGGITFLVDRMSALKAQMSKLGKDVLGNTGGQCPIPDATIRKQITVTLAEVLTSDPALARQLTSPNNSFIDPEVLRGIKNFCNGNARAGLTLVRTNCDYREYADVALMLDGGAKLSIRSTNVGAPEELFRLHKTEVSEHLNEVNKKARGPQGKTGVKVMRRQIHLSQTDKEQHEAFLTAGTEEARNFKSLYSNAPKVDFKELILRKQLGWPEFLGDYLVYDDRIILKFDSNTRVLMLLVGQEVIDQHVAVFSK